MFTSSISEIVKHTSELKTKQEKIEWLKKNNSRPLRNILKLMYDKTLKFNIPSTEPPYTPSQSSESHGTLYRETRKLKYFVEGYEGDNLTKARREAVFIQMLETVDKDDAKLLIQMVQKKPIKGITANLLNETFGEDFITKANKKK